MESGSSVGMNWNPADKGLRQENRPLIPKIVRGPNSVKIKSKQNTRRMLIYSPSHPEQNVLDLLLM